MLPGGTNPFPVHMETTAERLRDAGYIHVYLDDFRWSDFRQHGRNVDLVAQVIRAMVFSLGVGENGHLLGRAPVGGAVVRAFFHRGTSGRLELDSVSVCGLQDGGRIKIETCTVVSCICYLSQEGMRA